MSRNSNSSGSTTNYNTLLKKTEHYDKDERYMAISDLCEALKKNAAQQASSAAEGAAASSSSSTPGGGTNSQKTSSSSYTSSIDSQTERRICSAVLSLLDDSSNDVQTVAVKTLSVLLTTVQEEQVVEIADRLCTLVLDQSKSDLRDVYAIGLKTLVETVPSSMGNVVCHRLIQRLIDGIHTNSTTTKKSGGKLTDDTSSAEDKSSEEIVIACLNVLTDLITRFGSSSNSIMNQHEPLLNVTLSQLASSHPVVRKRAGTTIGVLATVISDTLLHRLVERILDQIDQAEGLGKSGKKRARKAHKVDTKKGGMTLASSDLRSADTRSLIRTMCTISGSVGHRLNQGHIDRIVPIFLRFCDPEDAVTGDDEDFNNDSDEEMEDAEEESEEVIAMQIELRESCFAGFESFVLRCPALIQPHLGQIIHSSLAYMRFDPNYSYGDEDDDEEGDGSDAIDEDDSEDAEDFEDEEYSTEDDMSDEEDDENWKVRRSAIRTLTSVVEATKHDPSNLWIAEYAWRKNSDKKATVAGALVNRFKEREENCRVDIIECFTRLLSYTVSAAASGVLVLASSSSMDNDALSTSGAVVVDLRSNVSSAIVKASEKQLSAKKAGDRSRSASIALLSTLCLAPGGLGGANQISSVFTHVKSILNIDDDKRKHVSTNSKSLKLEALCLVRIMLSCKKHDATHIKDALVPILLPEICKCVNEDWYKIISEALRVLLEVPQLIVNGSASKSEMDSTANSLYSAIEPRLAEHDLDQEIKECALSASASLLSVLHASLSTDQKNKIFELLLERLKNETTRIAAIKTLSRIGAVAQSNDDLDLSPILNETLGQLAQLLRQQSRGLKQTSLECLDTMVLCLGSDGDVDMDGLFDSVLTDLGDAISDTDLHICHLSLSASNSILKARPSTGALVKNHILPSALTLSKSPLLQDPALSSLLSLLEEMITSKAITFDKLRDMLVEKMDNGCSKQVISNLAECIATIAAVSTPAKQKTFIKSTISATKKSGDGDAKTTQLNLLVSGNFGRKVDLSSMPGVADSIQEIYNQSFDSSNEEIKHAAALALGRASVGAVDAFLPGILTALEESSGKKQYLLLSSLREFIHCFREKEGGDLSSSIPLILPHLEKNCENEEEGVRSMVAECFGSLACLEPATILPVLEKLATEKTGKTMIVRWTVGSAVKYAISGRIR